MAKNELVLASKMLPNQLIIYPIEHKVVFPGMMTQMITNREEFMDIINKAMEKDHFLGLLLLHDPQDENPYRFSNMHRVGVVAKVHKKMMLPDGSMNVFLAIMERFKIKSELQYTSPLLAHVSYLYEDETDKSKETTALTRSLIAGMKKILENNNVLSEEVRLNMINIDKPGQIADFLTAILDVKLKEQQDILETVDLKERMEKVLMLINREYELLKIQKRIQSQMHETIEKHKRKHFLRETMKEIKKELGEPVDGKGHEIQSFKKKIAALPLSKEVRTHVEKELHKLETLEPHHPEYGIILAYLEKVVELPWSEPRLNPVKIKRAQATLDKEHYGMEKVKKRIVEHLAISKVEGSETKSTLCLVGPPGVGKTSIARSIASALGKKLYHFSVGGMRDEAEIKGHRRTYIGAMPGKIIQGLLYVKEKDPIFVIDEIDKLAHGMQGDPASALLEVLDPVQNDHFRDLYLDLPFDLSKIFFITTANSLHTIPAPLLDRMEVIELSGYIDKEKRIIAQQYIIPKSLIKHGLPKSKIKFSPSAIQLIAENYAREAGMRHFEQHVNTIVRKIATELVQKQEEAQEKKKPLKVKKTKAKKAEEAKNKEARVKISIDKPMVISEKEIESYLGKAPYRANLITRATHPGTTLGLAWTSAGGDVLVIEAQAYYGKGTLKLTGTLGDVMKESAHISYSLVKQYESMLSPSAEAKDAFTATHEIHLHVPAGATPKDGPSAGITMASALLSLLLQKTVKQNFAMTGELSLIGQVLPIGGLREKIVAARRNKIKNIIIPKSNMPDLEEIPEYVKNGITIYPVSEIGEVFALLFPSVKQLGAKKP